MKKALIIIDIQNDYFPGGTMELHKSAEAAEKLAYKNETVEAEEVQRAYLAALHGTFASVVSSEELCSTMM